MTVASRRREERRFVHPIGLVPTLMVVLAGAGARAGDTTPADGRYTLVEENDYFFHKTNHWYTQGPRASYLTPALADGDDAAPVFAWLDEHLFVSEAAMASRHMDWSIGQSLFTPTNLQAGNPDPRDRPYAGWAYLDAGFVQSTRAGDRSGPDRFTSLSLSANFDW